MSVEHPFVACRNDYLRYTFNRSQACRFGLDATYVDPGAGEHTILRDKVRQPFGRMAGHSMELRAETAIDYFRQEMDAIGNDAQWRRHLHSQENTLPQVVRRQTLR